MFGGEFFFIIIVAFLLFGSKNLPEVVKGYAKILATLKNATNEIKSEIQKSVDVKEIDTSIKKITTSFTQEVENVKESVEINTRDIGKETSSGINRTVSEIEEDFENITGPVKRQM